MLSLDAALVVAGGLVAAAAVATRFARRFGVPAMLLFVGLGMVAGSSGAGLYFDDHAAAYAVGVVALAVIILSGGFDSDWRTVAPALLPAGLLASVGVVVKMGVTGLGAWLLTDLSPGDCLLLGAVLAPTDAAATFNLLRGRGLRSRVRAVLEAESSTNDPVSIYLTFLMTSYVASGSIAVAPAVGGAALQLVLGGIFGYVGGRAIRSLVNRVGTDAAGLYPLLVLASGLALFGLSNLIGGNGFLAVYVAGLELTRGRMTHRAETARFLDAIAWTAQIAVFLTLGLLVFPDRLPAVLPQALGVTLVLAFVARPVSLLLTVLPLRWVPGAPRFTAPELALLSWGGLKGAVPIVLAIWPLLQGAGDPRLFDIVFVVVLASTTVQGLTLVPLSGALGLLEPQPPQPPLRMELSGAEGHSGILDVALPADAPAVGRTLRELELPDDLVVAGVLREGHLLPARGDTRLEAADHLFLLVADVEEATVPLPFQEGGAVSPGSDPPSASS
ncbi:MAG: potassium/proton antiporter [Alphaproteobacteria bacterium]|nr:potassium/proton antiporter [Alphaproteobacteria bacterium]